MAEQSGEVEQAIRSAVEAMARSDIEALERTTSRDTGVLSIGSDADEWAEGYDEITRLLRASGPEAEMGVTPGVEEVKGYSEGSVGWGAARGYFEMEGKRVPVRMTAVLHKENGDWKMVQAHASIGVPNDRMMDPMFTGG